MNEPRLAPFAAVMGVIIGAILAGVINYRRAKRRAGE